MALASVVFQRLEDTFLTFSPSIFLPSVLSRLPLSCSHGNIGRRASDMWHSDICHLLFCPADAFYKFTKSWKGQPACSLLFITHPIRGADSVIIIIILSVFFFPLFWKVSVPVSRANPVQRRDKESVAHSQTVRDMTWQAEEGTELIPVIEFQ